MSDIEINLRPEDDIQIELAQPARDLVVMRGDTQIMKIRVKKTDGSYLDINGSSITMTVKEDIDDEDTEAKFQKTIGTGITILEGTNGYFEVEVVPSDTEDLDYGTYFYDIQIECADSAKYTVMQGKYLLRADITRS